MAGHWTDKFSYVTGVVRFNDLAYFALQDDSIDGMEMPHSQIIEWDRGNWGNGGQVKWSTVSMSTCKQPMEQMIAIGPVGEARLIGGGDVHDEQITSSEGSPQIRGDLRCVRGIGERAYAVGMGRQVYRREGLNQWVCIDQDLRPKGGQVVGFESIDGFSEQDIYVVGWEGEIWHFKDNNWLQKSSPTNMILTDVCCAGDGLVYASGRVGLLVRGRDDHWEVIEHETMKEDIWSMAWYEGTLYLSSMRCVFSLNNDRLLPVDMGKDQPTTCYQLSERDGVLFSIGAKDVMAFDGATWRRLD